MRILTSIFLLLISVSIFGQVSEIKLNDTVLKNLEKNTIDVVDKTNIYINDGSSNKLFYYALKPKGVGSP